MRNPRGGAFTLWSALSRRGPLALRSALSRRGASALRNALPWSRSPAWGATPPGHGTPALRKTLPGRGTPGLRNALRGRGTATVRGKGPPTLGRALRRRGGSHPEPFLSGNRTLVLRNTLCGRGNPGARGIMPPRGTAALGRALPGRGDPGPGGVLRGRGAPALGKALRRCRAPGTGRVLPGRGALAPGGVLPTLGCGRAAAGPAAFGGAFLSRTAATGLGRAAASPAGRGRGLPVHLGHRPTPGGCGGPVSGRSHLRPWGCLSRLLRRLLRHLVPLVWRDLGGRLPLGILPLGIRRLRVRRLLAPAGTFVTRLRPSPRLPLQFGTFPGKGTIPIVALRHAPLPWRRRRYGERRCSVVRPGSAPPRARSDFLWVVDAGFEARSASAAPIDFTGAYAPRATLMRVGAKYPSGQAFSDGPVGSLNGTRGRGGVFTVRRRSSSAKVLQEARGERNGGPGTRAALPDRAPGGARSRH